MRDVVICEPVRTAVGSFGGAFAQVPPQQLAAELIVELRRRTGMPAEEVDDVVLGQAYPSMDAPAIGRIAALDAGLPDSVPGLQIDRRCGSGLQAILYAAGQIQLGQSELILAGGVESMSMAPFYSGELRFGRSNGLTFHDSLERGRVRAGGRHFPIDGGMIETAENLRRQYGIARSEQDEYALRSHQQASSALAAGVFAEEIVPIEVAVKHGEPCRIYQDEHIRPDTSLAKLASLRPIRSALDSEATVTAGNASGQNDGAALCIVTHPDRARELGLRPLVRLVSWAVAGVPVATMGIGPVPAAALALHRAGLSLAEIDVIELNEAFAAQVLAVTREWQFRAADFDRLNPLGSGIALGHPVGATGARILATMSRHMVRRGAHFGLETMCIGGGQGIAAVFANAAD